MNNFKDMYVFELKKIFKRKIVWITLVIMLILSVFMGVVEATRVRVVYGTDNKETQSSGLELIQTDKENALSISGLVLDNDLLDEVRDAYKGVYYDVDAGMDGLETSTVTSAIGEETLQEAERRIGERKRFQKIFMYVSRITGDYNAIHSIDEEALYKARMKYIQKEGIYQQLTEGEIAYWQQRESEISKPFIYEYADGWEMVIGELYSLNVSILLLITICLSTLFSEEHVRKTDQLILCSKYGKKALYMGKILAGLTFGLSSAVVIFLASFIPTLIIYGTEGFGAALQIYAPMACWDITMGLAVLLMLAIYLVVTVLYCIVVMFLSEALRNSVAVMGLVTGGMMLTMMLNIPSEYRLLSQIYELLPTLIFGLWKFTDYRLVKVFGTYLTNLQIAPVLYLLCSLAFFFGGKQLYKNYQVSGR